MPLIDIDTFNTLRESMGSDFIEELISTYTTDTPVLLSQIRSALTDKDPAILHRAAHTIKSNAVIFGAIPLAKLAEELEVMGRADNLDVGDKVDRLETTYLQVVKQLEVLVQ